MINTILSLMEKLLSFLNKGRNDASDIRRNKKQNPLSNNNVVFLRFRNTCRNEKQNFLSNDNVVFSND